jgi:hypothetical protein
MMLTLWDLLDSGWEYRWYTNLENHPTKHWSHKELVLDYCTFSEAQSIESNRRTRVTKYEYEKEQDVVIQAAKEAGAQMRNAANKLWFIMTVEESFLYHAYFATEYDAALAYLNLKGIMVVKPVQKPGTQITGNLKTHGKGT